MHVLFIHAARLAPGGRRLKTATALECLRYTQVRLMNLKVQKASARLPVREMPGGVGGLRC